MKVAIYVRVSTNEQTTENQVRELTESAKRADHDVVTIFDDNGISGAKGPGVPQGVRQAAEGCRKARV